MIYLTLRSENGVVSIAYAMMIIVILFILGTALMTTVTTDFRGSANRMIDSKVFYACETGLEMAVGDIINGGNGFWTDVAIGNALVTTYVTNDTIVTSRAALDGKTRTIQIIIEKNGLPGAFSYMMASFSSSKKLEFKGKYSSYLTGKIFCGTNDRVKFNKDCVLDDLYLYVEEGTRIDNHTSYSYTLSEHPAGSTPVSMPSFSSQYYDDYINNVAGYNSYSDNEIDENLNLASFPGSVLFYDDDEKLKIEDGCTITGPGIIVSTDQIEIKEGVTIGPDVIIISEQELKIKGGSTIIGMGSVLYSSERVVIKDAYTSVQGSLISPGKVKIDSDKQLSKRGLIQGIIYAGETAEIREARIFGSIIANSFENEEDGQIKIDSAYLDFDPDYLPTICPPGLTASIFVAVKNGSWKEL